ncbi:hypothetical protein LguiB_021408 [Lonicera macranthoides]
MEETRLEHLPQDCISHVLSFTCPRDVRHSSLVSSGIRDACESDALWETFLPSNYQEIISRLLSPMVFIFPEVVELVMTHCIEIHSEMNNVLLSPNTTYKV